MPPQQAWICEDFDLAGLKHTDEKIKVQAPALAFRALAFQNYIHIFQEQMPSYSRTEREPDETLPFAELGSREKSNQGRREDWAWQITSMGATLQRARTSKLSL